MLTLRLSGKRCKRVLRESLRTLFFYFHALECERVTPRAGDTGRVKEVICVTNYVHFLVKEATPYLDRIAVRREALTKGDEELYNYSFSIAFDREKHVDRTNGY